MHKPKLIPRITQQLAGGQTDLYVRVVCYTKQIPQTSEIRAVSLESK